MAEAQATAKFVRMGPRKVRFVLDTIRGKYASDALNQLKFTPNYAADEIANVLRSAMANAENNHGMSVEYLKVARCYVDVGPTMKRVQPRAQGRAYRILKRSSHITIIVAEGEAPAVKTGPKKTTKPPLRAELKAPIANDAAPAETVEERDETASAPATDEVTPATATADTPATTETATAEGEKE
ncbi:MAG: 50S ribosomal protein L22 [Cytophagales bacterium]|nr:50S ribosomal protein L22 [Armatimonadota bacterium]